MTKKKKSILSDQRFIVLLVIIVLFAIFSFKSREFRQYTTILSMLDFSYYDLLMAIGVTFPLITGGVDLSIGTGMVCYALIAGSLVRNNNLPVVLAMLLCIVLGIIVGAANGVLIDHFFNLRKLNPETSDLNLGILSANDLDISIRKKSCHIT